MKTVNLYKWTLFGYEGKLKLQGICDDHPTVGKWRFIAETTTIQNAKVEDGKLIADTRNTRYICKLSSNRNYSYILYGDIADEIDTYKERYNSDIIGVLQKEIDRYNKRNMLDDTEYEVEEDEELNRLVDKFKLKLIDYVKDRKNTIYLDLDNDYGNRLVYNIDGKTGVIDRDIHSGMFQDSVLYIEPGIVDFRYFPKGAGTIFETYSLSDNIEHIIIKNSTNKDIRFNEQLIKIGETAELDMNNHYNG